MNMEKEDIIKFFFEKFKEHKQILPMKFAEFKQFKLHIDENKKAYKKAKENYEDFLRLEGLLSCSFWCEICQYSPQRERHHIILQASFRARGIPVDESPKNIAHLCNTCHDLAPDIWEEKDLHFWESYKKMMGIPLSYFIVGFHKASIHSPEIQNFLFQDIENFIKERRVTSLEAYEEIPYYNYSQKEKDILLNKPINLPFKTYV